MDTNCYGCGKRRSDEVLELLARLESEGETPELVEALNAHTEHEPCFN